MNITTKRNNKRDKIQQKFQVLKRLLQKQKTQKNQNNKINFLQFTVMTQKKKKQFYDENGYQTKKQNFNHRVDMASLHKKNAHKLVLREDQEFLMRKSRSTQYRLQGTISSNQIIQQQTTQAPTLGGKYNKKRVISNNQDFSSPLNQNQNQYEQRRSSLGSYDDNENTDTEELKSNTKTHENLEFSNQNMRLQGQYRNPIQSQVSTFQRSKVNKRIIFDAGLNDNLESTFQIKHLNKQINQSQSPDSVQNYRIGQTTINLSRQEIKSQSQLSNINNQSSKVKNMVPKLNLGPVHDIQQQRLNTLNYIENFNQNQIQNQNTNLVQDKHSLNPHTHKIDGFSDKVEEVQRLMSQQSEEQDNDFITQQDIQLANSEIQKLRNEISHKNLMLSQLINQVSHSRIKQSGVKSQSPPKLQSSQLRFEVKGKLQPIKATLKHISQQEQYEESPMQLNQNLRPRIQNTLTANQSQFKNHIKNKQSMLKPIEKRSSTQQNIINNKLNKLKIADDQSSSPSKSLIGGSARYHFNNLDKNLIEIKHTLKPQKLIEIKAKQQACYKILEILAQIGKHINGEQSEINLEKHETTVKYQRQFQVDLDQNSTFKQQLNQQKRKPRQLEPITEIKQKLALLQQSKSNNNLIQQQPQRIPSQQIQKPTSLNQATILSNSQQYVSQNGLNDKRGMSGQKSKRKQQIETQQYEYQEQPEYEIVQQEDIEIPINPRYSKRNNGMRDAFDSTKIEQIQNSDNKIIQVHSRNKSSQRPPSSGTNLYSFGMPVERTPRDILKRQQKHENKNEKPLTKQHKFDENKIYVNPELKEMERINRINGEPLQLKKILQQKVGGFGKKDQKMRDRQIEERHQAHQLASNQNGLNYSQTSDSLNYNIDQQSDKFAFKKINPNERDEEICNFELMEKPRIDLFEKVFRDSVQVIEIIDDKEGDDSQKNQSNYTRSIQQSQNQQRQSRYVINSKMTSNLSTI
eukprot:403357438